LAWLRLSSVKVPELEAEAPEPRPEVLRAGRPWAEVAPLPPWRAAVPQQLREAAAAELPQSGLRERSSQRDAAGPPLVYWKGPFARA
jgi:hypothetical protein